MRIKIGEYHHPVLEQVMDLSDDESKPIYHNDRFRFTLYDIKSEQRKQTRYIEIRIRKAVVFLKDQREVEPMMVNVFEWLNLDSDKPQFYNHVRFMDHKELVDCLTGWLTSMTVHAHPFPDEFTLSELEAKAILTGFMSRIGIDGFYREISNIIKVI